MQISLPKKQQRSGSVKILDHQQVQKSIGTSSRRNISSRSQYTKKNLSTFTIDTIGACCSGHGLRFKNINTINSKNNLSNLDQISTLGLKLKDHQRKQSKNKNSIIKQTKNNKICNNISTNISNIDKTKSKLEYYTQNAIDISINKIKKQKNNKKATNKAKSTKKVIKQNITSKNSTSKKNSRKQSNTNTKKLEQVIKMTQINPFVAQNQNINIKRKSRMISCKKTQSDKDLEYGRTSYLKRQKTPQNMIIQEVLDQITYPSQENTQIKHNKNRSISNFIHSTNYNSANAFSQNTTKQNQMLNLLQQQLTLKKQQQKCQQSTITQLKQNNIKLQQELFDSYRKYQNVLETQNDHIRSIQCKKDDQIDKIKLQTHETQCKLASIQELCQKLKQEKQILIQKYRNQFSIQKKERNAQKQQLLKKIYIIEEKYKTLQNFNVMLEKQNKQLKQSTVKATTQRQKYEKAMKKYENQITQLQGKLQVQIKKTKQQEKQIENLRKQKVFIKQNSQIVLEIVRNQLKQKMNEKKAIEDELLLNAKEKQNQCRDLKSTVTSWGSSTKKYENMQNMSPRKKVLQQNNY